MSREKKVFAHYGHTFKLYAPVDLSKMWFLEWKEGGKRKKKYGNINKQDSFKARMLAAEKLAKELAQILSPPKSVDQEKVDNYISDMSGQWRPSTVTNVKAIKNKLFEWLAGRELDKKSLERFFVHLKNNRHGTTYNNYRQWLFRIFEAIDRPYMFVDIPTIKSYKTPARYFQPHQIEKLRSFITENEPELWLYIQFVFYCFIRPSRELPQLKAGNFMMEEKEIWIKGSASKNKKTQYVAIPDAFFPKLDFIYDMGPGEYIFPSRRTDTKPIGRNTMYNKHYKILKHLNFGEGYCMYSWKHTGAIQAVKAGISVKELQIQLRHHSLDETDKYLRQMGVRDVTDFRVNMPDLNKVTKVKRVK